MTKTEIREFGDNGFELVGILDGKEIICIDLSGDEKVITMSRNLPLELSAAREHLTVLNAVFAEVNRIEANERTTTPALISSS